MIFQFVIAVSCFAAVQVDVLESTTFVRSTGEPVAQSVSFAGVVGNATIYVTNGHLEDTEVRNQFLQYHAVDEMTVALESLYK
jgi:hypothetical protein